MMRQLLVGIEYHLARETYSLPDLEYRVLRHQKRTLLTALHAAEEACFPVAQRQVVLILPKRLRVQTHFLATF